MTTTKDKLKETMELYQKRVNLIDTVVSTLESKINNLNDTKELLTSTTNTFINSMNNILNSLDKEGDLYKNKYYGKEDLQGWAWYKSLSYDDLVYIDDDTFYINSIYVNDIKVGDYILVKDSKYGYMERYIKKIENTGSITKIYLHTSLGPLSNPISLQQPYLSHNNLYPSCENPGKMPDRTDCCAHGDKDFDTCDTVPTLGWKKIETNISGSGTQQLEISGGLKPYDWWIENTTDFKLLWDQTESNKNILTYNYKSTGSKITVTDYCKSVITEEFMPQELEYLPGVFKIIVSPIAEDIDNYVVFINISESSGINKEDLTFLFDEVGEDWRKIYVRNEDETELLFTNVDYWEPENKRGALYVKIPHIYANQQTILMCRFGIDLPNNDTNIWQLKTSYPTPPQFHGNENNTEFSLVYNGVWSYSQGGDVSNHYGYQSVMNFGCINDWCRGQYSSDTSAILKLNNYSVDGSIYTKRHFEDPNNFIEKGYNNIRNAISNKDIIVDPDISNSIKEYIFTKTYGVGDNKGWSIEVFFKREMPFGPKETTQEERDEYVANPIHGANGPHDEYFFQNNNNTQQEPTCIYWNATDGSLTMRYPKQYDNGNWEHPEWNTFIYYKSNRKSWPNDWTHIAYVCDNENATIKLYVDGELDSTYNIIWQQYFTNVPYNISMMNVKTKINVVTKYWNNWSFITIDNFKKYNYTISQERIKANIKNLKDNLCSYELLAKPKWN